ncbi:MTA/SAH nucleosidase [Johnsonella ignava ATCC 51276]|uniref:adenosylhomocysteine nucleosidase n=1 Tax=Johnsonella ignava ATCC 51276 TaxID=679200 RepID=G5GIH0_9FIRM|nr:5'-methylthioadenosine/adenosylhomocysteine nucleosidase [Johnsonella ignava]EHI55645.1 MTA/SAH nucleosidase [Johnsonella ignava ATCC 51276]
MIGIIGAMEEEIARIKPYLKEVQSETLAGMLYHKGMLYDKEAVLVHCGIGKVNAALCTQIIISVYKADAIINTGIAGGLANYIDIGDIVISNDAVQHDVDATGFGYKPGQIPRMDTLAFEASTYLAELAYKCCKNVNPDISAYIGRIATGDIFVSDFEIKKNISDEFNALCAEMEGGAIAQVSYLNKVPFVIIRAVSDKADASASMDYSEFEAGAITHCSRLTIEVVKKLDIKNLL